MGMKLRSLPARGYLGGAQLKYGQNDRFLIQLTGGVRKEESEITTGSGLAFFSSSSSRTSITPGGIGIWISCSIGQQKIM